MLVMGIRWPWLWLAARGAHLLHAMRRWLLMLMRGLDLLATAHHAWGQVGQVLQAARDAANGAMHALAHTTAVGTTLHAAVPLASLVPPGALGGRPVKRRPRLALLLLLLRRRRQQRRLQRRPASVVGVPRLLHLLLRQRRGRRSRSSVRRTTVPAGTPPVRALAPAWPVQRHRHAVATLRRLHAHAERGLAELAAIRNAAGRLHLPVAEGA